MDFEVLASQLGSVKNLKLSEPNTELIKLGAGSIGIKFYSTIVVRYHSDGSIEINSDGLRSKTTKNRINKYLPDGYRVKKVKGKWIFCKPNGKKIEFGDRFRFNINEEKELMMNSKKPNTIYEAVMYGAQQQYERFCSDITMTNKKKKKKRLNEQEDPASAPVGTRPPPPGEGNDLDVEGIAPPPSSPGVDKNQKDDNAVQELADEIYELMKKEGDISEGFIVELFREKGYDDSTVSSALKVLENDGRAGKRSTYYVSIEDQESDTDDEAGITPQSVEGDEPDMEGDDSEMPEGGKGADVPPPPAPKGGSNTPPMGMKNKVKNNFAKNYMEDEIDDLSLIDDDEDEEMGNEIGGMSTDIEDDSMDDMGDDDVISMVDEVEDDIKDLKDLINSIQPNIDSIKDKLSKRSIGGVASKDFSKNPYFSGGGANYPEYGQANKDTGLSRRR